VADGVGAVCRWTDCVSALFDVLDGGFSRIGEEYGGDEGGGEEV